MKQLLVAGLLTVLTVQAPLAEAGFYYDSRGKTVITNEVYDGPGFTLEDLPGLGFITTWTAVVLSGVFSEPAALAPLPLAIIAYGAWRTNKYRPEAVKARIRENLRKKAEAPHPGSTREVLGY